MPGSLFPDNWDCWIYRRQRPVGCPSIVAADVAVDRRVPSINVEGNAEPHRA
jgi:hypothetical protein